MSKKFSNFKPSVSQDELIKVTQFLSQLAKSIEIICIQYNAVNQMIDNTKLNIDLNVYNNSNDVKDNVKSLQQLGIDVAKKYNLEFNNNVFSSIDEDFEESSWEDSSC